MIGTFWLRSLFLSRVLVTAALLTMAMRGYGGAGIATDGSVGARQTIAGANAGAGRFVIPQALGSVVGNNLFHSFSKFNIDTGQTADFTTSTATPVSYTHLDVYKRQVQAFGQAMRLHQKRRCEQLWPGRRCRLRPG